MLARDVHLEPLGGLTANAFATAGALVGLVIALGPLSGGHFNPLITLLQWLSEDRTTRCMLAYCAAQFAGGLAGAALANAISAHHASPFLLTGPVPWGWVPSELVCSAGLMLIVFGCIRSGNRTTAVFAVGAWLTAAIFATPSRSIANPAITLGVMWVSIAGTGSLPGAFLVSWSEIVGALLALLLIRMLYPRPTSGLPELEQPASGSP
jgi:glycerol uptake facilitator-like aquaporin